MGMVEVILIGINLMWACETSHRLKELELEVKYGTYPSDTFPQDPRHQPVGWLDYCGW